MEAKFKPYQVIKIIVGEQQGRFYLVKRVFPYADLHENAESKLIGPGGHIGKDTPIYCCFDIWGRVVFIPERVKTGKTIFAKDIEVVELATPIEEGIAVVASSVRKLLPKEGS